MPTANRIAVSIPHCCCAHTTCVLETCVLSFCCLERACVACTFGAGDSYQIDLLKEPFKLSKPLQIIDEKSWDGKHMLLFDVQKMTLQDSLAGLVQMYACKAACAWEVCVAEPTRKMLYLGVWQKNPPAGWACAVSIH